MKRLLKRVYLLIPFKKTVFLILKKVWPPPQKLYRHLHFKGKFKVKIEAGKSFQLLHHGFEIENEIFWRGLDNGWEKVSIGLWRELCRTSKVIFDIGANTGVYSLVAKTINPGASVYAFEPVSRVYDKLVKNCELNAYPITCFEKAVSNYTGKAVIYDTAEEHVLSVTVNKNLQSPSRAVKETEIQTVTLRQIVEDEELTGIDLMKIDVETHEPEVLEGLGEYLARFRPAMLIEILTDEVGAKVKDLVQDLDYLYFNIDENNGIRQVKTIDHSDYYNYLLCSKQIAQQLKLISS
jgi:FkbM family methyltransferase